ncbi:MAG: flavin reductase [Spirochaetales bacterium]|nr:flavin reductase [Spirochaetales bacterium]
MNYEHDNCRPEYFKENWEGKWKVFSWIEFVCAIPHVLFMVTTLKENGLPNASFQSWSSFTGEGDNYYIIMSGVMKHTHTFANIKRNKEFCINFLNKNYLDQCWKTIKEHNFDNDEITAAGFTLEDSRSIKVPGIKESFLKMECCYEWEKELCPNSHNITICGIVKHISIDEHFAKAVTKDKYGKDSFMFHLHSPINPFTGEIHNGGVGTIEYAGNI